MMEQKSLNTLIDVDGTWQRSKAHFFPISGLGFCLPPNYLDSEFKILESWHDGQDCENLHTYCQVYLSCYNTMIMYVLPFSLKHPKRIYRLEYKIPKEGISSYLNQPGQTEQIPARDSQTGEERE